MPLFREPYCSRCMLVTDDKHPGDLLDSGHIDSNIRKAIRLGADPAVAVKMATLVPAQYFGFKQRGAVAPGYRADLVVVSDRILYGRTGLQEWHAGGRARKNADTRTA